MNPPSDEPRNQEENSDRVEDVIDVEAIPRALVMPHPREGAVQAVAEPVERQEADDQHEGPRP